MSLLNKLFDLIDGQSVYNLNGYRTIAYTNKWTPIAKDWRKLELETNTNPISKKCVNVWQSLADYYELKVKVEVSKSKKANERAEKVIQRIIDKRFKPLVKKAIQIIAEKGNAYLMINSDNELIVQHPDFFNIYWDSNNQKPYCYKYIINGVEQPQKLQHGVEIYHLRNPFSQAQVLSSAPIEAGMKEIEAYTSMFAYILQEYQNGLSGNVLATVKDKFINESTAEVDGVPKWAYWSKTLSNLFNKTARTQNQGSKIIPVNFAESFFKFGGNLRDIQALEILEKQVEFIASCFNLTAQDLGFGKTTYNNTTVFAEQQEEKIGKPLKLEIELALNSWVLPKIFKIDTYLSSDIEVWAEFEPPNNEDLVAKRNQTVELFKVKGLPLTDIEKRQILIDAYDLDIVADDYEIEPVEEIEKIEEPVTAPATEEIEETDENFSFKSKENKKLKYLLENRVQDKAFDSFLFARTERDSKGEKVKKGFLAHLENAFEKQIKRTVENMVKNDSKDVLKNFVKLETVLPFNVLSSDLKNFGDYSKKETEKEIKAFDKQGKVKNQIGFELSQPVKEYFDARTQLLLQGYDSLNPKQKALMSDWNDTAYKGIDAQTLAEIEAFIKKNADLSIEDLTNLILKEFKEISEKRAVEIAETEVVNAIERVRYNTYLENDFKFKRHLTVNDSRVVDISRRAESKGIVPIDFVYEHQIGTGLSSPLHFRERGSEVYGITKEDLEF